jgi:hypothetical protein
MSTMTRPAWVYEPKPEERDYTGTRLWRWRNQLGLSDRTVARRSNIRVNQLREYEYLLVCPTLDHLCAIGLTLAREGVRQSKAVKAG